VSDSKLFFNFATGLFLQLGGFQIGSSLQHPSHIAADPELNSAVDQIHHQNYLHNHHSISIDGHKTRDPAAMITSHAGPGHSNGSCHGRDQNKLLPAAGYAGPICASGHATTKTNTVCSQLNQERVFKTKQFNF